jgi:putative restriction endonuclease
MLFSNMRIYVGITDRDWFQLHASRPATDEVNFWKPSPTANFKVPRVGEPLLFKLHTPDNYIAGGGFFTRFLHLPISLAWDAFREANGVTSLDAMRARIADYRNITLAPADNPHVGCMMLAEPFFRPRELWIPTPPEFIRHIQQGKGVDATEGIGRQIWDPVADRLKASPPPRMETAIATLAAIESGGYGKPQIVHPRLGQGSFRILLTDTYERRWAVTGERTLPVLDAAHITPYTVTQRQDLSNGLLMRSLLPTNPGWVTSKIIASCDRGPPLVSTSGNERTTQAVFDWAKFQGVLICPMECASSFGPFAAERLDAPMSRNPVWTPRVSFCWSAILNKREPSTARSSSLSAPSKASWCFRATLPILPRTSSPLSVR